MISIGKKGLDFLEDSKIQKDSDIKCTRFRLVVDPSSDFLSVLVNLFVEIVGFPPVLALTYTWLQALLRLLN